MARRARERNPPLKEAPIPPILKKLREGDEVIGDRI